jgi:hypothetical protein
LFSFVRHSLFVSSLFVCVAQSDGLRENAPAFTSGVATLHTAGEAAEPSRTNYSWHDEERGESDILKWHENSYVATVQSERTHLTYFTKKHLRWFTVTVTDIWWCLGPSLYGSERGRGEVEYLRTLACFMMFHVCSTCLCGWYLPKRAKSQCAHTVVCLMVNLKNVHRNQYSLHTQFAPYILM